LASIWKIIKSKTTFRPLLFLTDNQQRRGTASNYNELMTTKLYLQTANWLYTMFQRWCYWQGNGLVVHRSRVWVLAGHHCVITLGKLFTPVCLRHQAVLAKRGDLFSWAVTAPMGLVESNGSLPLGLW